MDSVDLQVLKKADEWLRSRQSAVLGTVIRTWGSAPRPVGSLVAVRGDGLIVGSVSGGCIEDDLVERIRSKALAALRPQRVTYGVTADEAFRFGLTCGGTIELVTDVADYFTRAQDVLAAEPSLELISAGLTAEASTTFARKAQRSGAPLYRSVHRRR